MENRTKFPRDFDAPNQNLKVIWNSRKNNKLENQCERQEMGLHVKGKNDF